VLLPVGGVDPQGSRSVGNVRFSRVSNARLKSLQSRFGAKKRETLIVGERLLGVVIAEVRVTAVDAEAAKLAARRSVQRAIDVLNFFADFLAYAHPRAYVLGTMATGRVVEVVYASASSSPSSAQGRLYGPAPLMPMGDVLGRAKRRVFRRIHRMMAQETLSEVERRILQSVEWLGRAAADPRSDSALLSAVIALEGAIIGPAKEAEIGMRLRLRTAKLLARSEARRREVASLVTELYALRSRIAHTGFNEVLPQKLKQAKQLARVAILELLRRPKVVDMKKNDDLERWMNTLVLR
jgi:hypothetical protein